MKELLKRRGKKVLSFLTVKGRELQRLKSTNRFQEGTTTLFKFKFKFVDAVSFAWQYDEIFNRGIYEFKSTNDSPFIIDCGANVGTSVLYFGEKYAGAKILAFEPDKKVFEILSQNVTAGKLPNVSVINKAVWNCETTLDFFTEGADGGSLINIKNKNSKVQTVETVRLRQFLDKPVDFLKLDIEGAEVEVMKDCDGSLSLVSNIFIEYHSSIKNPQRLDELLHVLSKNGFRYFVESATIHSEQPFLNQQQAFGYDNLLNIYAFK